MPGERRSDRDTPIRGYVERLDFGRRIHRTAHDGALLALCEDYGDEEECEPSP